MHVCMHMHVCLALQPCACSSLQKSHQKIMGQKWCLIMCPQHKFGFNSHIFTQRVKIKHIFWLTEMTIYWQLWSNSNHHALSNIAFTVQWVHWSENTHVHTCTQWHTMTCIQCTTWADTVTVTVRQRTLRFYTTLCLVRFSSSGQNDLVISKATCIWNIRRGSCLRWSLTRAGHLSSHVMMYCTQPVWGVFLCRVQQFTPVIPWWWLITALLLVW